jgi:hypothetical protein
MALKASKALRNGMLAYGTFRQQMADCFLRVYSGPQPSTAEAAPTGTLLCTYSRDGGAITREVRATGSITLSGVAGSVTSITVAGIEVLGVAVPFTTDLTTTAALVAEQINDYHDHKLVTASSSGAVVTLTAQRGFGAQVNNIDVTTTVAGGMGAVDVDLGDAVLGVSAVNGLNWDVTAAGVISKDADELWEGTAVATGTAGWARFEASTLDSLALDSTEAFPRLDGAIATSGAELNLGNTSFVIGVPQIVTSFQLTFPTA